MGFNMKVVCAREWIENSELGSGWGDPIVFNYIDNCRCTDETKQQSDLPYNMSVFYIDSTEDQVLIDAPDVWVIGQGTPEEFMVWLGTLGMDKQSVADNAPLYNLKDPELIALLNGILEA